MTERLERALPLLHRLVDGPYNGGYGGTCYECPFGSEPLDMMGHPDPDVWNDPTEAYFSCHLPGRDSKPQWGEYAPCTAPEWFDGVIASLNTEGGSDPQDIVQMHARTSL